MSTSLNDLYKNGTMPAYKKAPEDRHNVPPIVTHSTKSAKSKNGADLKFRIPKLNPKRKWLRVTYWWTIIAFLSWSFSQSIGGALAVTGALGFDLILRVLAAVGVTGSEGILLAWAYCPKYGIFNEEQERIAKLWAYRIVALQLTEVGFFYAYKGTGEIVLLYVAGVFAGFMVVAGLIAAHYLIDQEEEKVINTKNSTIRIEVAKANAELSGLRERQKLENKRAIIAVENRTRDMEKRTALNALSEPHALKAIDDIGRTRAMVVIKAYERGVASYAGDMLGLDEPAFQKVFEEVQAQNKAIEPASKTQKSVKKRRRFRLPSKDRNR